MRPALASSCAPSGARRDRPLRQRLAALGSRPHGRRPPRSGRAAGRKRQDGFGPGGVAPRILKLMSTTRRPLHEIPNSQVLESAKQFGNGFRLLMQHSPSGC